jgi:hypothetical protein
VIEHSLAPALSARRGVSTVGALGLGLAVFAGVRALRAGRAGRGTAGADVAPSLTTPDYGAERYGQASVAGGASAVADSAEGAQFTPGGGGGSDAGGWRPSEGAPGADSLTVGEPGPATP